MSATRDLREELAHVADTRPDAVRAELSAALRFGASLTLSRAGVGATLTTTSGAVARRIRTALGDSGARPGLEVHSPQGLRARTRYRLALQPPAAELLTGLGLLDAEGRPVAGVAGPLARGQAGLAGYLRGVLLVAGSLSDPEAAPHLEVAAPGPASAAQLAVLLARAGGAGARASEGEGGWRVVAKSGPAIGSVLVRAGAHAAFLRLDEQRLRRELRADANRAANADRANLGRGVTASTRQVATVARVLASADFELLPSELREVALARIANPAASLAELGALLDPPVGKATVHRRLARLERLPERVGEASR